MKRYYILKVRSYEGEESSLTVNAGGADTMYVVLLVGEKSAEIVDWGYDAVEQLLDAWSDVEFANIGEFK